MDSLSFGTHDTGQGGYGTLHWPLRCLFHLATNHRFTVYKCMFTLAFVADPRLVRDDKTYITTLDMQQTLARGRLLMPLDKLETQNLVILSTRQSLLLDHSGTKGASSKIILESSEFLFR